MKINRSRVLPFLAFGVIAFVSCQDNNRQAEADETGLNSDSETQVSQQDRMGEDNTIFARTRDNSDLTTFSQSLDNTEVSETFRNEKGPYTIFAPANSAYDEISEADRNEMNEEEQKNASLHYLVVENEITADELRRDVEDSNEEYNLTTMQGENIAVTIEGQDILLRDASGNVARIIGSDTNATNGIIHTIDGVLRPMDPTSDAATMNREAGGVGDIRTTKNNKNGTKEN